MITHTVDSLSLSLSGIIASFIIVVCVFQSTARSLWYARLSCKMLNLYLFQCGLGTAHIQNQALKSWLFNGLHLRALTATGAPRYRGYTGITLPVV